MKITPTALTINQLFGSANEQFVIPAYQRRYSWRKKHIFELIEDIDLIDGPETHLLGNIVCLSGHHSAQMNRLELVDGQQRLTTLAILLECVRQKLEADGASDSDLDRLLRARTPSGERLPKVALDSLDSADFIRLSKSEDFDGAGGNPRLAEAFQQVRSWIAGRTHPKLQEFLYKLLNQALIIRLDVSEAKDAFKLFETINNRGLRLSPTDLIKNFVLGNAARFGGEELDRARASWTRLVKFLDGTDSDSFFRNYLISVLQRRLTKAEVVPEFEKYFMNEVVEANALPERHLYIDAPAEESEEEDEDGVADEEESYAKARSGQQTFSEFLDRIVRSAKAYGELVRMESGDALIDRHLKNLRMIKSMQTYGFLMHLRAGGIPPKDFIEILKLTEAFVLRRHVCRERANETEALFARLCAIDPKASVRKTREGYRSECPTDDKFRDEFASAQFRSNIIERARYCLGRIELVLHGGHSELEVLGPQEVHVEHIIPQKIRTKRSKKEFGDWESYLGERADSLHPKYVSRIGNLTLFAGALNIGASNNPFSNKKTAYSKSAILMTKDLTRLPSFKFRQVDERSKALADKAVEIWPIP